MCLGTVGREPRTEVASEHVDALVGALVDAGQAQRFEFVERVRKSDAGRERTFELVEASGGSDQSSLLDRTSIKSTRIFAA